jgi:hypothetical protein
MRRRGIAAVLGVLALPGALIVAGGTTAQAGASTTGTGSITGNVVNATTNAPISGICVNVVTTSNTSVAVSKPSGPEGNWTVSGVPAATDYTATAYRCKGTGDYVGQWYDDENYQSTATTFTVTAGKRTTGIDFSLSPGGAISGKVTDSATEDPVQGILVIAFWTTNFSAASFSECTSSTGSYRISGLPTTGVKVDFVPNDCGVSSTYGDVWFKNKSSYDAAKAVPVTAGATTTGINQEVTATSSSS